MTELQSHLCVYTPMMPCFLGWMWYKIKNTGYRNKWLWSRSRRQSSKSRHHSTCSNIRGALAATTGVRAFYYDAHSEGPATLADILKTKEEANTLKWHHHGEAHEFHGTEISILSTKQTLTVRFHTHEWREDCSKISNTVKKAEYLMRIHITKHNEPIEPRDNTAGNNHEWTHGRWI